MKSIQLPRKDPDHATPKWPPNRPWKNWSWPRNYPHIFLKVQKLAYLMTGNFNQRISGSVYFNTALLKSQWSSDDLLVHVTLGLAWSMCKWSTDPLYYVIRTIMTHTRNNSNWVALLLDCDINMGFWFLDMVAISPTFSTEYGSQPASEFCELFKLFVIGPDIHVYHFLKYSTFFSLTVTIRPVLGHSCNPLQQS